MSPSNLYIPNGETSFLGGPTLIDNPSYLTKINSDLQLHDIALKNISLMKEAPGQSMQFGIELLDDNKGVGVFNGDMFRNIVTETTFDLIRCVPSATASDLSAVVEALHEEFLLSFQAQSTKLSLDRIRDAMSAGLPFEYEVTHLFSLNGVTMEATLILKAYQRQYLTRA